MPSVYSLRDAELRVEAERPILQHMDWTAPARSISVIFGAGGAGKTSLLRALAGVRGPPVTPRGAWIYQGRDLFAAEQPQLLASGITWCAQPPRDWPRAQGQWGPGLRHALGRSDASVLLLDEPNAWVDEREYPRLIAEIRGRARESTIVMSTHNIEFGRSCADRACLLGGGRILAADTADAFFASPLPQVRHFLRSGSLHAGAVEPAAPPSLRWVLDRQLGGMARPGLTRPLDEDLEYLQAREVTVLVTLTEDPLDRETRARLADHGISELLHFPIRDMGVPSMAMAATFAWRIARKLAAGRVVVVHCRGGLGRTGLVLALVLMTQGQPASAALEFVRSIQPLYVQTERQEAFIHAMEPYLGGDGTVEEEHHA
jgi:atypical dual specificity phosphatase